MWLKDNSFGVVEVFDRWGEEDGVILLRGQLMLVEVGGRVVVVPGLVGGGDRLALFCIVIPTYVIP